jgi:multicomponent Na+:H+ antiporter subunit F
LAEAFLFLAAILLFLAILCGLARLMRGPTLIDRITAVDMLTVVSISLIALYARLAGRFIYLDVALVYGVLSFLGVLAIARYLERGL